MRPVHNDSDDEDREDGKPLEHGQAIGNHVNMTEQLAHNVRQP